jgi:predicted SAM-dependent methyltransferase
MPIVSVIMPSYNHARYVRTAVESVLSQTVGDLELIVIDDGSTDGTREVLDGIRDDRLRCVFRERNVGASAGSNDGLALARSPFVAMISSDDLFAPTKLERQLQVFEEDSATTAVFCTPRLIDGEGRPLRPGSHPLEGTFVPGRWSRCEVLAKLLHEGNFLCHPSVMVRRETYDRVGGYDPRMASLGDFEMWMRMAVHEPGGFVTLEGELLSFRLHATNASAATSANVTCGMHEWPLVVRHLRDLRNRPDLFAEAFPETAPWLAGAPEDVDFAFARLAAGHRCPTVRALGVQVLYELMHAPETAARLRDIHGFAHRDLIALAAATDTSRVHDGGRERRDPPHVFSRVHRETKRIYGQLHEQFQAVGEATSRAVAGVGRRARRSLQKPGYTEVRRPPMSSRHAAAVTADYVRSRMVAGHARGVHIGCGDKPFAGWLNVDLGGQPDLVWDLSKPFSWAPDGTFDHAYSEHVLEHFPRAVGRRIVAEIHRTLRPGGVVRIAVPDLRNVIGMYVDDAFLASPTVAADVLEPTAVEARALFGDAYGTRGERLNVCMYGWGHAYLYDEDDLVRLLTDVGFTDVARQRHSQSPHADLSGRETRPEMQSALIVEGTKPHD